MPKLKAVIDALEEVPEGYRDLYAKGSGDTYVLQIEDPKSHPAISGLVSTLEKQKTQITQLKASAKAWDELKGLVDTEDGVELTPQDVFDAIQDPGAEGGDAQAKISEGVKAGVAAAQAKFERELSKITGERDKALGALRGKTVDADLDTAIAKAGVLEKYRPAVRAVLKQLGPEMVEEGGQFRGVFKQDPDGIPRDLSIDEFVGAWAKSENASPYMPAQGGGSGAKEAGGGGQLGAGKFDGSDPMAWGQNAEKIAKGELTPA